jgi:hypothetical protein
MVKVPVTVLTGSMLGGDGLRPIPVHFFEEA